jgi:hypothetical protein
LRLAFGSPGPLLGLLLDGLNLLFHFLVELQQPASLILALSKGLLKCDQLLLMVSVIDLELELEILHFNLIILLLFLVLLLVVLQLLLGLIKFLFSLLFQPEIVGGVESLVAFGTLIEL